MFGDGLKQITGTFSERTEISNQVCRTGIAIPTKRDDVEKRVLDAPLSRKRNRFDLVTDANSSYYCATEARLVVMKRFVFLTHAGIDRNTAIVLGGVSSLSNMLARLSIAFVLNNQEFKKERG